MNQRSLLLLGILTTSGWLLAEPMTVQAETLTKSALVAQAPPPETFRDPVAQVDPNEPIQIRVVNASEDDIDVGAFIRFPPTDTRIATPGESVTFGVLHTSFLPPPIDLQVYAVLPSTMIDDMTLDTDIVARNNEIIITVAVIPITDDTETPEIRQGIRVTESGEVYLF